MTIQALPDAFSVCKVADYTLVDREAVFCFSGQTDAERSLVCRTQDVPDNVTAREDGWRAMRITGTLDIKLARPRARSSEDFLHYRAEILRQLHYGGTIKEPNYYI